MKSESYWKIRDVIYLQQESGSITFLECKEIVDVAFKQLMISRGVITI